MRSDTDAVMATELQSFDTSPRTTSPERRVEDGRAGMEHEMPSLPPVDGGKDAWLFLAACFMIEALVWGMRDPDSLNGHKTNSNHTQDSATALASSRATTAPTSHLPERATSPSSEHAPW